jgi:hypothetical protein
LGSFRVYGGQIIDPAGRIFRAKGINLTRDQSDIASTDTAGTPLLALFPGLNCVRVSFDRYNPPDFISAFVEQMSGLKLVTIIEDQTETGQQPYTGDQLTAQLAWYADMARAFSDNPYVWFGSLNEARPVTSGIGDDVTTNHIQIYNTIRGTGNSNIIHLCVIGGGDPESMPGENTPSVLTASRYSSLKNIVWDYHVFGRDLPISDADTTVQEDIATTLQKNINRIQSITSADGIVPLIIGEFGESSDGSSVDPGATAVVNAVGMSGYGFLAWAWNSGGDANNLTDRSYNLTSYGQQIAGLIASQ